MRTNLAKIIFKFPEGLDSDAKADIYCSSQNKNILAKCVFYNLDTFVQEAIIAINNNFGKEIFSHNQMNLLLSEDDIEDFINNFVMEKYGASGISRDSKEQTLRAFNFIKPANLLPTINYKIYTIRFQAVTKEGSSIGICVNPFFYGFLLSFAILLFYTYSGYSQDELFDDIELILEDKYGSDLANIFHEVLETFNKGIELSRENSDQADESFISELANISGLLSANDFEKYIYNPFVNYCTNFISKMQS
jgi:hypothetical protein